MDMQPDLCLLLCTLWLRTFLQSSNLVHISKLSRILFMPPTLKKWGHIGFGLSVCLCVCVCVWGASRHRLETSCMDSSWKNSRHVFFSEMSPLVKLRPFEKQRDEIL